MQVDVTAVNNAPSDLQRSRPDRFNSNGSLKVDEVTCTTILAEKTFT